MRMPCHRLLSLVALLVTAVAAPLALAAGLPKTPPTHIVVVIMENHAPTQIVGSAEAPYINSLARDGATFTRSFGVTHPSQPNYLALFSGSTHGVKDDRCPLSFDAKNLAQQLFDAGKTFVGYSEGLPSAGFTGCAAASGYARKHAPWVDFDKLPSSINQPFSTFPVADFEQLPTVAVVVPSLNNDMHDGTVAQGDNWLKSRLGPYVQWSKAHNSLLIVTWDEDDGHHGNQILTIFHGPMVRPGSYSEHISHYDVLRTLEDLLGLMHVGKAASRRRSGDVGSGRLVHRGTSGGGPARCRRVILTGAGLPRRTLHVSRSSRRSSPRNERARPARSARDGKPLLAESRWSADAAVNIR